MTLAFPTAAGSITAEWLSGVVGAPVNTFSITALEGGVVSDLYRVHDIGYAGSSSGAPASFVIKMAAESTDRREVALACNAYGKEVNFYRLLAAETPVRCPAVYACADDGAPCPEHFVIVMEDLSTGSTAFDQADDGLDEEFARNLGFEAAHLHAHFWDSDARNLPWLGRPDGRYVFPLDGVSRACAGQLETFAREWRAVYDEDLFHMDRFGDAMRLGELLCGPSSALVHDRISDVLSTRPKTILHGDMRADNVFRSHAVGPSGDHAALTFIDWQLVHAGPPGLELTQAWVHSLEPDVRRKELELLREYRETLVRLNPAAQSYTYEMLVEDYFLGCCLWLSVLISVGTALLPSFDQPGAARMKRLWYKMLTRSLTAVAELPCLSLVESVIGNASR
jgi:aminoglycoside phosphotransferase (APT) family kinase protein